MTSTNMQKKVIGRELCGDNTKKQKFRRHLMYNSSISINGAISDGNSKHNLNKRTSSIPSTGTSPQKRGRRRSNHVRNDPLVGGETKKVV